MPIVTGMFHVAVVMGMMFERAFRKNVIAGYTGVDCIKQHFGYSSVKTSLFNKTLKIAKMMLKSGVKSSLILKIRQIKQSNLQIETMRYIE